MVDPGRPVQLIINPQSGYGGNAPRAAELARAIRRAGFEVIEHTTTSAGDATEYVRRIGQQKAASAVVVWGGDGTVNEVVSGLAGTNVPILPCLAGTENLLAKELKIPRSSAGLIEVLRTGEVVDCDVGVVNGRTFLLIIGIGFDGEVVRRLAGTRTGHISHLSYFWPIWRTFWEHRFPRMRIIADGEEIFHDYGLAFVGNISRYAVGLRICRDATFDDGLLDLVIFGCQEQTALVLHAAWTLLRLHPLKGSVIYRQFKHLHVETDEPVPSQIDGDPGCDTPLEISVSDRRAKLLIPAERQPGLWPWKGVLLR